MVRTLLWVSLLDQAFVIFNHIPPRLTLRELEMGLACSEACFQAPSASECFNHLKQWITRVGTPRSTSLCSLIQLVCAGEMDSSALDRASREGFMNLWCVVSCKSSIQDSKCFRRTQSGSRPATIPVLGRPPTNSPTHTSSIPRHDLPPRHLSHGAP